MSAYAEARDLTALLADRLDGVCTVTMDPVAAAQALMAGEKVLVVGPPNIEYPNAHQRDLTWEAIIASGPINSATEAWELLDDVLDALEANQDIVNLQSAAPSSFQLNGGRDYPGYVIRFNS